MVVSTFSSDFASQKCRAAATPEKS
jgi:hypothetical protein